SLAVVACETGAVQLVAGGCLWDWHLKAAVWQSSVIFHRRLTDTSSNSHNRPEAEIRPHPTTDIQRAASL
ncbi:MAG TPA: hypothetical protein PLN33_20265, partial [Hyphomonadaceae bacterium]|nr:hypothetical protein [Hyphomonadaceae bacterium]